MSDRLVSLLQWFELRARVFQAGLLCRSSSFDASDGLGYVHVLRRGQMCVTSSGKAGIVVNEPSLVFFMTPSNHQLQPLGSDVDIVCASFEFGAGLQNPLVVALPDSVVIKLDELPNLSAVSELLFAEAAGDHCGRQAILNRLSEVLIVQLLREFMDQGKIQSGLLAGLSNPRLVKAINAIHADPSREWTLEQLAALANMSRARFAVHFRDTIGTTPMAYINDWRLSIARSLLRQGKSLQIVAEQIGYSSASAFSRAFVAQVGMSPSEWRRLEK